MIKSYPEICDANFKDALGILKQQSFLKMRVLCRIAIVHL